MLHNFVILKTEDIETHLWAKEVVVCVCNYKISILKASNNVHLGTIFR